MLLLPNTKSVLTDFDGFDHYNSICVFPQPKYFRNILIHNKKIRWTENKKDAGPSKLRWESTKQMP